ncbi:MAG: hypothetical protein EXS13_07690 [Planctomycetes bacterium]|nr:hypothetical protein [Planctomycetota bacterium]
MIRLATSDALRSALALALLPALLIESGCQVNGTVHLFRANADGKLYGPWAGPALMKSKLPKPETAAEPGSAPTTANSKSTAAERSPFEPLCWFSAGTTPSDTYSLIFDQAFFKYLPDIGTANEVIVVFRFYEGTPTPEHEDVRILGPMSGITDGNFSSAIGEVTYSPKPVESDALRVRIQIYEYDSLENKRTAQFIGFLGDAAKSFQLANPVTLAEVELAKAIADTLVKMNGNDLVFECSMDLLPTVIGKDQTTRRAVVHGNAVALETIPLQGGTWGVIKQEAQSPVNRFFYFTAASFDQGGDDWWLSLSFTLIGDLAMLPITGIHRAFLDSPSGESLAPVRIDARGLRDDGHEVRGRIARPDVRAPGERLQVAEAAGRPRTTPAASRRGGQIVDRHGKPEPDPQKRVDEMLDSMQSWLAQPGHARRVLIHVHGGMTTIDATIERANRLIATIKDDAKDSAYPLFVSWPSGGFGS